MRLQPRPKRSAVYQVGASFPILPVFPPFNVWGWADRRDLKKSSPAVDLPMQPGSFACFGRAFSFHIPT